MLKALIASYPYLLQRNFVVLNTKEDLLRVMRGFGITPETGFGWGAGLGSESNPGDGTLKSG